MSKLDKENNCKNVNRNNQYIPLQILGKRLPFRSAYDKLMIMVVTWPIHGVTQCLHHRCDVQAGAMHCDSKRYDCCSLLQLFISIIALHVLN